MSVVSRKPPVGHSPSRTLAATLGTVPVAFAVGIALGLALPLPVTERYLIGTFAVFPLWVGLSCWTFLARSGRRAWCALLVVLVIAASTAGVAHAVRAGSAAGPAVSP